VDSSTNIPTQGWANIVLFLKGLIRGIGGVTTDPNTNRFGLISYASKPSVVFTFNSLSDDKLTVEGVAGMMDSVTRGAGDRRIDLALLSAQNDLFSVSGGMRPLSKKVMSILQIFFIILIRYNTSMHFEKSPQSSFSEDIVLKSHSMHQQT